MVHARPLRPCGAAPVHRDEARNRAVSSERRARSSRTASPDPGSLVVGPHRARFRGDAGGGRARGHAIQS